MDRTDKLINNREPGRMILWFIAVMVLSGLAAWFISAFAADHIVKQQVSAMLAAVGGGKFNASPSEYAVAAGIDTLKSFGITQDIDPRFMDSWQSVRMLIFGILSAFAAALDVLWLIASLHQLSSIYDQLELLHNQCLTLSDDLSKCADNYGDGLSCVSRVAGSINLMARRVAHAQMKLSRSKRELSEFMSDFSHQLKTALAVVRLNTDMLTDMDSLSESQRQQLCDEIVTNVDSMEALVLEALKLARLDADAVSYNMECLDLEATCQNAVARIMPILRRKNITVSLPDLSAAKFPHDKLWLGEAIENILKNAADHSGCTHIQLEVSDTPALLTLSLTDNGKGIPQSRIPALFARFSKSSSGTSMTSMGLGMSIARKVVIAHSGDISVYSQEGHGTRFDLAFLR